MLGEKLEESGNDVGVRSKGCRLSGIKRGLWLPSILSYTEICCWGITPGRHVNSWDVCVRSGIRVNQLFQNISNNLNQYDMLSVLIVVQKNQALLQVWVRVCIFKILTLSSKKLCINAQRWKDNLVPENSVEFLKKTYHLPLFQPV